MPRVSGLYIFKKLMYTTRDKLYKITLYKSWLFSWIVSLFFFFFDNTFPIEQNVKWNYMCFVHSVVETAITNLKIQKWMKTHFHQIIMFFFFWLLLQNEGFHPKVCFLRARYIRCIKFNSKVLGRCWLWSCFSNFSFRHSIKFTRFPVYAVRLITRSFDWFLSGNDGGHCRYIVRRILNFILPILRETCPFKKKNFDRSPCNTFVASVAGFSIVESLTYWDVAAVRSNGGDCLGANKFF